MSAAEESKIGQAIYTWSTALVDGSRGMGFSTISPSLEGYVDWLSKLQPPEFKLFRSEVTGQPQLYAARKGFSEVGRIVRNDTAIIFRKTADGAVDAQDRPQPVVHGLIGDAATLGLSYVLQVQDGFWRRGVESGGVRIQLDDLTISGIPQEVNAVTEHVCPDDHKRAEEILALVAGKELERLGTIDLPADDTALAMVFLAFPAQVAEGFWLAPYVTTEGIRRELGLTLPARVPQTARSSPTWDWKGGAAVTAASARCPFQEAVAESAARFVYGDKPHLSKYAEEVLEISKAPPGTRRSAPAPARGGSGPAPEASPVRDLLQEIQPDGDPLPELLSERLADRLRAAHIVPWSVVNLPTEDLTRIFMNVQDGDLIAKWARYFGVIGTRRFIELWNSTHVSAFMGLVLVKSLSADRGDETVKIAAERGVDPELTASILLSMKRHDNGGLSIGRAIKQGLGNSDSMRNFIAEVFRDDPEFLFDIVLREAGVSDNQILDYIRICYDEWATYRQLPENESKPIQRAIRLTLIQKAHRLISR